jgi:hypothetical protein
MNEFIRGNRSKLIAVFCLLLIAVLLAYYCWSLSASGRDDKRQSANVVENMLKAVLPADATLREYRRVPDLDKEAYLGIYILNFQLADLAENRQDDLYYSTCPELSMGQTANGEYHIFLFEGGEIADDELLPSYERDDTQKVNKTTVSLAFNNTKQNNADLFGGVRPSEGEKFDMEKTGLMQLRDLNGDGLAHEFQLVGDSLACGHLERLIAGYDAGDDNVIVYPIKIKSGGAANKVVYWWNNFTPDGNGRLVNVWHCGDHGAKTEVTESFAFDRASKSFVMEDYAEKKCE